MRQAFYGLLIFGAYVLKVFLQLGRKKFAS